MLPGKRLTPEDVLGILWRRKWVVVVPFCAAVAAAIVAAPFLPNRYRSEAVMVVVPQRVPETYVRSTVTTRIEDRLRSFRQEVLSRTRLEVIITEFNLYAELRQRLPMEDVVERMRRDVQVTSVPGDAFRISYVSGDAKVCQRVVERLAGQFNEDNLRERSTQADATTEFLQSQLDRAKRDLQDHERKLADFQRRHAGELPSEREANVQMLNNTQMRIQQLAESVNRDRDRHLFLERQVAEAEAQAEAQATAPAPAVIPAAGGDPSASAAGSAASQLEAARAQLTALSLRFKSDHPDIKRLRGTIRDLEERVRAEELQAPLSGRPQPARPSTPEESARQTRLRDMRAELSSLEIRISTGLGEQRRLEAVIASYNARLAAIPNRESELTALTRDYDTLNANYRSLLERQQNAKIAADLERRQIGEQFRLLDPPRVPERPFSPNRLLIFLGAALGGLGLGAASVALLEYADKSIRSERDVVSVLALPVLASIPLLLTRRDRRRLRRRRIAAAVAAAVVLGAVTVTVAVFGSGFLTLPWP